LLFMQWPLRDLVQWGSREANDAAQCLFAVFVAVAITAATRARTHLASDAFAHRLRAPTRRKLAALALLIGVLPWSLYMLVAGAPDFLQSLRQLERFPDTFNPGYFIVKGSAALMALCAALQAVVDLVAPTADDAPGGHAP
ncbi:MAG: TRAP transporter small permease subunit, partial [Proteobacteria bacterium]|nr:TRAP transporter small permease subunit [Pseudomonadota bacterium]